MAAPAPKPAPLVAPPINGSGNQRLAEASIALTRARVRVQGLTGILNDPGSTREAVLEAGLDLPEARKAEEAAELALIRLSKHVQAEEHRHRQERAAALEPEVKTATRDLQAALEGVRDGPYATLVAVLKRYLEETGNSHRFAAELAWPPQIFQKPEGASEDIISYRRRWLVSQGFLSD